MAMRSLCTCVYRTTKRSERSIHGYYITIYVNGARSDIYYVNPKVIICYTRFLDNKRRKQDLWPSMAVREIRHIKQVLYGHVWLCVRYT